VSAAWKEAERRAAKALGGTRNKRGEDFSQSVADVSHPLFAVEVKQRKKFPQLWREGLAQAQRYDTRKPPLLVIHEHCSKTDLVCLKLKDFVDLFGPLHPPPDEEE
jgi:hypothetical protein